MIEIRFDGRDRGLRIRQLLTGFEQRLGNLTPALERIARSFRAHMAYAFRSGGANTASGPWRSLSPDYATWKAQRFGGRPPLTRTGRLAESFSRKGAPGHVELVTRRQLIIGSDLKTPDGKYTLWRLHQEGSRRGLPARKIVDPPAEIQARWGRMIADYVMDRPGAEG